MNHLRKFESFEWDRLATIKDICSDVKDDSESSNYLQITKGQLHREDGKILNSYHLGLSFNTSRHIQGISHRFNGYLVTLRFESGSKDILFSVIRQIMEIKSRLESDNFIVDNLSRFAAGHTMIGIDHLWEILNGTRRVHREIINANNYYAVVLLIKEAR